MKTVHLGKLWYLFNAFRMAKQSVATLKGWFETGDKPTQQQFWDWLDSFIHKDDAIAQSQITGLVTSLNSLATQASVDALKARIITTSAASASIVLPAGVILTKVRIKSSAGQTVNIGTMPGESDIYPCDATAPNQVQIVTLDYDIENVMTVYFSGLSGNNNIKIYLEQ
ncbi:MAG: hypothetical protein EPGJADBJ_04489 [Saprospiraceae bacterium]|nr:hypothetical protein [Saprospiraceae bacterium]